MKFSDENGNDPTIPGARGGFTSRLIAECDKLPDGKLMSNDAMASLLGSHRNYIAQISRTKELLVRRIIANKKIYFGNQKTVKAYNEKRA